MKLLIRKKADVNAINNDKLSPLCLSIHSINGTRLLLEHGANPDYQNPLNGNTPFHYAIQYYLSEEWPLHDPSEIRKVLDLLKIYSHAEDIEHQRNHAGETPNQLFDLYTIKQRKAYARLLRQSMNEDIRREAYIHC